MTEEQETIERLNRFKTIKVLYGNTFAMHTEQLRTLQEDIETVLNMLKEKDRQINSKNGTIDALQCALKERTEERDRKDYIIARYAKLLQIRHKSTNLTLKTSTSLLKKYKNRTILRKLVETWKKI